jgi:hypothetical protein
MQPAPQDMQLMSKHRVLSLKPYLRLEWRGQDGQSETEQPDHSASLSDSITSSTRIRFSVHTGSYTGIASPWNPPCHGFNVRSVGMGSISTMCAILISTTIQSNRGIVTTLHSSSEWSFSTNGKFARLFSSSNSGRANSSSAISRSLSWRFTLRHWPRRTTSMPCGRWSNELVRHRRSG